MNKKIITGLIALMGISILGIIIIQLVWMNNAINVKSEMFDRSVNEALTSAASRLETMQDFRMINHFSMGDTANFPEDMPPPPPPPAPSIHEPNSNRIPIRQKPTDQQIEMIVNAERNRNGFQYNISAKNKYSGNGREKKVTIVNKDSLAKNLHNIYSHGINKLDSLAEQYDELNDSSSLIKRRFEIKTHRLKRVANRIVNEITLWEENELSTDRVSEILKKELQNRDIPIPFEFGIIKDSLISSKTGKADSIILRHSNYKVNLFPNDIFQKNIKLSVYFPEKQSFIYKTLNWLLIISLIFSIIVLVTFAVSIYFILKQKKISEMKSDFINNMTHAVGIRS